MGNHKSPLKKSQKSLKQYNTYVKYSGLAFQMIFIIGIPVTLGVILDNKTNFRFPLFTLIFSITGLVGLIYWLIKSTSEKDKV